MVLKKLKLKNFRGYRDFEVSFDDAINVIIVEMILASPHYWKLLKYFSTPRKSKWISRTYACFLKMRH